MSETVDPKAERPIPTPRERGGEYVKPKMLWRQLSWVVTTSALSPGLAEALTAGRELTEAIMAEGAGFELTPRQKELLEAYREELNPTWIGQEE